MAGDTVSPDNSTENAGKTDTDLHESGLVSEGASMDVVETVDGRNGGKLRPVRTPEAAAALSRRRWDRKGQAARAGLRDALAEVVKSGDVPEGVKLEDEYDYVRYATAQHAINALDPSARGAGASLREVLKNAFPEPAPVRTDAPLQQFNQFNLGATAARELLDELRRLRATDGR